jgi:hypothetical protein
MAKLNTYVHVVERNQLGELTGRGGTFGPDDELPDWAEAAITNPDVWNGWPPKHVTEAKKVTDNPLEYIKSALAAATKNTGGGNQAAELEQLRKQLADANAAREAAEAKLAGGGSGQTPESQEPPRAGSKASREAWAKYAESLQIEVPAGASMTQIIALVDEHKAKSTAE